MKYILPKTFIYFSKHLSQTLKRNESLWPILLTLAIFCVSLGKSYNCIETDPCAMMDKAIEDGLCKITMLLMWFVYLWNFETTRKLFVIISLVDR